MFRGGSELVRTSYHQGDKSFIPQRWGIGCGQDGGSGRLCGVQPGEGHTSTVWCCHTLICSGCFCMANVPCLLLISQGFCFLFFLCSLRLSSSDGLEKLRCSYDRKSGVWKLAVNVSAGLNFSSCTVIKIMAAHFDHRRCSTLSHELGEGSAGSKRIFISRWRERSGI